MQNALVAWIYALMLLMAPPEKRVSITSKETLEQMKARYMATAIDMASVVVSEKPLFSHKNGYIDTAALILGVSFMESNFRHDVDIGKCWKGSCDEWQGKATSFCLMQIHIGEGKTEEGWDKNDLIADRKKCFRAGLNLIRKSIGACGYLSGGDKLSGYTNGTCQENDKKGRARWDFSFRLHSRVKPPEEATKKD